MELVSDDVTGYFMQNLWDLTRSAFYQPLESTGSFLEEEQSFSRTGAEFGAFKISFEPEKYKVNAECNLAESSFIGSMQRKITETLSLTIEDLAKLCGVTSKTLYNWRSEEAVINRQKKGMDRLFVFSKIANNWESAGYPPPGIFLQQPLLNGQALFEILSSDEIDQEGVIFIGSRIALQGLDVDTITDPFA